LLIIIFAINTNTYSQVGSSISYSVDKALGFNVFYTLKKDTYYVGYSHQFNGQKNEVVSERKSNYGTTIIDDGDFYWLIDLGYSRVFFESLSIQPEISFGSKKYFTSYKDNRFKDGGYSLIDDTKGIIGLGMNLGYRVNGYFEPYVGFHSIKKLTFGVRIHFNQLFAI